MSDEAPPDPRATFREWVSQWERNFDSIANQVMGTEGFSQIMNEAQKSQLALQNMFSQATTQQLINLNMPTRDDILRLTDAVQDIDRRLERIEQKLDPDAKRKTSAATKPPRTKQPRTKQPRTKQPRTKQPRTKQPRTKPLASNRENTDE